MIIPVNAKESLGYLISIIDIKSVEHVKHTQL